MAEYHGDIGRFSRSTYKSLDVRRLVIAYVLLFTLGFLGAHRLYLGMNASAFVQLCIFGFGLMFGLFAFNPGLFVLCLVVLSVWLLFDIFLLAVMLS